MSDFEAVVFIVIVALVPVLTVRAVAPLTRALGRTRGADEKTVTSRPSSHRSSTRGGASYLMSARLPLLSNKLVNRARDLRNHIRFGQKPTAFGQLSLRDFLHGLK